MNTHVHSPDFPRVAPAADANSSALLDKLKNAAQEPTKVLDRLPAPLQSIISLVRVKQWIKNTIVFFPLVLAPTFNPAHIGKSILLFLTFCLVSSFVYVINDLVDAEKDRLHPEKCHRPIASGAISRAGAGWLAAGLMAVILAILPTFSTATIVLMSIYVSMNYLYSVYFKSVAIIEVFFIASGFVLRILTGGEVSQISVPVEFLIFAFFFCLFVAIGKRRRELTHSGMKSAPHLHRPVLREYNVTFLDAILLISVVIGSMFYWLYAMSAATSDWRFGALFAAISALAVTSINFRYLQIIYVDGQGGEPVASLSKDKFIVITIFVWIASYWLSLFNPT